MTDLLTATIEPLSDAPSTDVRLESKRLRVEFEPKNGGKAVSFVSKRNGYDYFYKDPRSEFTGTGYSQHDISGMDECFPAVAASKFPRGSFVGKEAEDHGSLWNKPWSVEQANNRLSMACSLPEIGVRFERDCELEDEATLRFDYRIRNLRDDPLPFIYANHLMLALEETTLVSYPPEMDHVFVYAALNLDGLTSDEWIAWPWADVTKAEKGFSPERGAALKMFSNPLKDGSCSVGRDGSGEKLMLSFDTEALPYLGVMISQGFGPSGEIDGQMILGLEGTTSVGDDFETSEKTKTTADLDPLGQFEFWIRLSLKED